MEFKEDKLIDALTKIFNLHWKYYEGCDYLVYEDDEIFYANEHEFLNIPDTNLEMNNENKIICDGIMFFGDGCVEFRDKIEQDAYHWSDFTNESFKKIEKIVLEMLA